MIESKCKFLKITNGKIDSVEYINNWSTVAIANTIEYYKLKRGGTYFFSGLNSNRYGQNLIQVAWVLKPGNIKAGLLIYDFKKP